MDSDLTYIRFKFHTVFRNIKLSVNYLKLLYTATLFDF